MEKYSDSIQLIQGFELASCSAGIYEHERHDLVLIRLAENSKVSVRLTQNAFAAAPIKIVKYHLQEPTKFLLINAGNANAGNGQQGIDSCLETCFSVAKEAQCKIENVLPFSTGVIGEPFPTQKVIDSLPNLFNQLAEDNWQEAAKAIMTTDTKEKLVSKTIHTGNETLNITGMAKGAGMIRPNMATMLAYIATDIDFSQKELEGLMDEAVAKSFNRITVDGDTSTNDACVLISTGKKSFNKKDPSILDSIRESLNNVYVELATAIIKDAEGATKFITIDVGACADLAEANKIAYSIAESPLVKTALYASDPNWGRILAAIGKTDILDIDVEKINIYLEDYSILTNGARAERYDEKKAKEIMEKEDITIRVEMNRGDMNTRVWTSDLSHDYVTINAEYRT